MKKFIIILSALAVLFSSCTKEDAEELNPEFNNSVILGASNVKVITVPLNDYTCKLRFVTEGLENLPADYDKYQDGISDYYYWNRYKVNPSYDTMTAIYIGGKLSTITVNTSVVVNGSTISDVSATIDFTSFSKLNAIGAEYNRYYGGSIMLSGLFDINYGTEVDITVDNVSYLLIDYTDKGVTSIDINHGGVVLSVDKN